MRDPEPVELAALADGSLPPSRSAALEARVAELPELDERLAEQLMGPVCGFVVDGVYVAGDTADAE